MTAAQLIRELQQCPLNDLVVWETKYDGHSDWTHIGSVTVENARVVLHRQVEKPAVAQSWLRTKA